MKFNQDKQEPIGQVVESTETGKTHVILTKEAYEAWSNILGMNEWTLDDFFIVDSAEEYSQEELTKMGFKITRK